MRTIFLLVASMSLNILAVGGVALAADVTCPTGEDGRCEGTPGDDLLWGTPDSDEMFAREGDDTLYGNGEDDDLSGEAGDDHLNGGAGNDTLDYVSTSLGGDTLNGGPGLATLSGTDCDPGHVRDTLNGGEGGDSLDGSSYDRLNGNAGPDEFFSGGCRAFPPVAPVYVRGYRRR